ncbi:MAG: hypothetical protein H7Y32_18190 [Chloroflexales bacterium]|nr:hypothetical protein [Chloroflexales bacterium]
MSETKDHAATEEVIRDAVRQTIGALTPERRDAVRKSLVKRIRQTKGEGR